MDKCRIAYEARFKVSERSPEHYYVWQLAWNAAVRTIANETNSFLTEF